MTICVPTAESRVFIIYLILYYVIFTYIYISTIRHNIRISRVYKITSVREIWLRLDTPPQIFFYFAKHYITCHLPPGFGDIWQNIGQTSALIRKPTRHVDDDVNSHRRHLLEFLLYIVINILFCKGLASSCCRNNSIQYLVYII